MSNPQEAQRDRDRILFFTYYRVVPTGQIGVFKRCLRLMSGLLDQFEVHLVNYGPLPDRDGLFDEIRPRVTIHPPREENGGLGTFLRGLMKELHPSAAILGETPLRGNMWLSHRIAASLQIRQVCIENYYGSFVETYLPAEWPDIHSWLFIGLPPEGEPVTQSTRIRTLGPLIGVPPVPPVRDRICVLGYDQGTLISAIKLLESWPGDVDYIIAPAWRDLVRDVPGRVLELPSDETARDCLARARLVIGKAGFQQIVEAIALGAPVICRVAGGSITEEFLPGWLKPFVRFIHDDSELPALRRLLPKWLESLPPNPWAETARTIPDPVAHASNALREMIVQPADDGAGSAAIEWEQRPWSVSLSLEILHTLLRLAERKDWQGLEAALQRVAICVEGVEMTAREFVREMACRVLPESHIKVVLLDKLSADAFRCCVMTIEPDCWDKQEVEFTVRLGFGKGGPASLSTIEIRGGL